MSQTCKRLLIRSYIVLLMLSLAVSSPLLIFAGLALSLFFYRDLLVFVRERKILLLLAGLFLFAGILSSLFSPFPASLGLRTTIHYGIFIGISLMLLFLITADNDGNDIFFLQVLVGLAILLALLSFAEVNSESLSRFLADRFRNGERLMVGSRLRTGATLNHSNVFGCFMSLAMLILIYLKERTGLKAMGFYPAAAILAAAVILSGSRNAVFVLIVPLLLLLLNRKTAKTIALMVGIAVIGLVLLTVSTARFSDLWKIIPKVQQSISTVETESGRNFNTASTRLWLWQSTLAMFYDHPLTGVGPGSSNRAMKDYASERLMAVEGEKIEKMYLNAHNGFLNILAEFGLAGSAVGLTLALYLLALLIRHHGVFPPTPVHAVLAGVMLSFMPDAFFYSNFYMSVVLTLFLLFAFPGGALHGHAATSAPDQPDSGKQG